MGTVKLKDGRIVCITLFQLDDKEKLGEMYALLSAEAVRWAMQPYTPESLKDGLLMWPIWFLLLLHAMTESLSMPKFSNIHILREKARAI